MSKNNCFVDQRKTLPPSSDSQHIEKHAPRSFASISVIFSDSVFDSSRNSFLEQRLVLNRGSWKDMNGKHHGIVGFRKYTNAGDIYFFVLFFCCCCSFCFVFKFFFPKGMVQMTVRVKKSGTSSMTSLLRNLT